MATYIFKFPTPQGCWTDLTRRFDVTVTIITFSWVGYRRYIALVKIEGDQISEFLAEMEKSKSVRRMSLCKINSHYAVVEVDAIRVLPVYIFAAAEIMIYTPIIIKNGMVTAKIYSNSRTIGLLMKAMERVKYPFEIKKDDTNYNGLTKKQRYFLREAIKHGYYSFPRKITLTELAEKLGVSKSYLSETLQIIESKLLGEYLQNY